MTTREVPLDALATISVRAYCLQRALIHIGECLEERRSPQFWLTSATKDINEIIKASRRVDPGSWFWGRVDTVEGQEVEVEP